MLQTMFRHNYCAAIGAIGGFAYLVTYPQEIAVNNCVPSILLHSAACATGKSTALSIATALHGQPNSVSNILTHTLNFN